MRVSILNISNVAVMRSLLVLFLFSSSTIALEHDVLTANGIISGKSLTVDGRTVFQFVGIPFAKPPLANLRFLPPQPLEQKWSEHVVADTLPKGCLQPPALMNFLPDHLKPSYGEDCLYLHVWTPTLDQSANKSVLVWIHGGAFVVGEGLPVYNGSAISSLGDVVVVTIQYRLGFLGFARFDRHLVPGNNGLLDQQMALRWVNENIENFGGDPASVTIFGESAGSASVSLHLVNEESGKLFQRGIMQSGSLSNAWAVNPNTEAVEKVNRELAAKYLSCDHEDTVELVRCLQGKSEAEMLETILKYNADHPVGPSLGPVIDGHFLSRSPRQILASGEILKKDVIIGLMEREGDVFSIFALMGTAAAMNYTDPDITKLADDNFVNNTVNMMFQFFPSYPNSLSPVTREMIRLRSLSHVDPKRGDLNAIQLSKRVGEAFIDCEVNAFADAVRAIHDNVYFYQIVHKLRQPLLPVLSKAPEWMKATHGDDIALVFALPMVIPELRTWDEEEMGLTRRIIADFTTFAKTGVPQDPNWRRFTQDKKEFYRYGVKSSLQTGGVNRDECVFWDKVVPLVNGVECRGGEDSKSKSTTKHVKEEL